MTSDPTRHASRTARGAADLDLTEAAIGLLRSRLPAVAEDTVRAVIVEVPGYTNALAGPMGANIQDAVQLALGGFLSLASRPRGTDPGTPLAPALEGAYALGRGEARSGRSMDALLAAYRVGARVSWRELSATAVEAGLSAQTLSKFAELVFAYIDELSAASVAGHTDELATTGRVRERYLQRLGRSLLRGDPADQLAASAERADWEPPRTLTAVVLPSSHVRGVLGSLDQRTLRPEEDLSDLGDDQDESELAVLLVPDADGAARGALLRTLRGHQAHVGPAAAVDVGAGVVPARRPCPAPRPADRRRLPRRHRAAPHLARGRLPTRRPWPTCVARCWRRSTDCGRPRSSGSSRRCGRGCSTRVAATTWPALCTCIPRPCATGWARSATCWATGSTTPRSCSP